MQFLTLRLAGILLNRRVFILPFLLSLSPAISAACVFKGVLYSAESRLPVEAALVSVSDGSTNYNVISTTEGIISIELPREGAFKISISHVSHAAYQSTIDVKCTGGTFTTTIYLIENDYSLKEVTVNANQSDEEKLLKINEHSSVSYHLISPEKLQSLPAVLGDPGRMATTLPGVMGTGSDDENEVVVRGNTPRGNSWRVENLDIPMPLSHFSEAGLSGGNISIISPQLIGQSEFFTSAYPANYGNAYGGVFDIRLRTGSKENHRLKLKASILGTEAGYEGNIKGKYTYNFNYRYSTLALVQRMGIDIKGLDSPQFQDFNFKMAFPLQKGREVTVFGVNGQSSMGAERKLDDSTGESVLAATTEDFEIVALNGMSFTRTWNSKKKLGIHAGYFHNNYISDFAERSRVDSLEPGFQSYIKNFFVGHLTYKTTLKRNTTFTTGAIFNQWFYDLEMLSYSSYADKSGWVVNAVGQTQMFQAYATLKHQLHPSFNLIWGAHTLYFNLNKKYSIEPRIYLNWQPAKFHKLSYGFGMHSKTEDLSFYLTRNAAKYLTPAYFKNFDLTRSLHNVISYRFVPNEAFNVTVEVYYQYLYRLAVSADSNETFFSSINESGPSEISNLDHGGNAYSYGIDFAFSFTAPKRWLVLFNSSLFDSRYTDGEGKVRNTAWSNNFSMNTTVGKEFVLGKNEQARFRMGATCVLAGGRRYVPIDLEKSSIVKDDVFDPTRAYQPRGAPYYRIDAQIAYILKRPKFEWEIKIDIQNVTNRENEVEQDYVPNYGIARDMRGQIIPILSTSFDFLFTKKKS